MRASIFIKPMHPKTEISPTRESIEKILKAGWKAQLKIHGHRSQIHLHPDPSKEVLAYNRHGRLHKKLLSDEMTMELRRVLDLENDWTVVDAEWIKPKDLLYVFDILKLNGESLRRETYEERYSRLPRAFISPHIKTLPLLSTVEKCLAALNSPEDYIEGLVFKSMSTKGFSDSAIVRCRKKTARSL